MSIRAMVTVLDHAPDQWSSGKRLVAIVIADHVDADGVCWPSVNRIAKRAGMSRRQVQTYLKELVSDGVIERLHRTNDSNWYRWLLWTELGTNPSRGEAHFIGGGEADDTPRG